MLTTRLGLVVASTLSLCAFAAMPIRGAAAPAGSWTVDSSPIPSATGQNVLNGVVCVNATDCWAVGHYTGAGGVLQNLVEHGTGSAWAIVASPDTNTAMANSLSGVACINATDCWAVGFSTEAPNVYRALTLHYDGSAWSIVASANAIGTQNFLTGVTCAAGGSCWAVGFYYDQVTYQTLIEQNSGSGWAVVTSPNTSPADYDQLFGVACAGANDCSAVGYYSTPSGALDTLIEQDTGSGWVMAASPNPTTTDNFLQAVSCVADGHCWGVGYAGYPFHTLVEERSGGVWTVTPATPNANPAGQNSLYGVSCVSASDCWAVGAYSVAANGSTYQTLIEHFDGTTWAVVTSPNVNDPTAYDYLYEVSCTTASDCRAVGFYAPNGSSLQPMEPLAERYAGASPPPQVPDVPIPALMVLLALGAAARVHLCPRTGRP